MDVQVITVNRQQGVGKQSGRAFNFLVCGCVMQTAKGHELVEVMLDGDHPPVEPGKRYTMELAFYPDREKRLAFRVEALRPAAPPKG